MKKSSKVQRRKQLPEKSGPTVVDWTKWIPALALAISMLTAFAWLYGEVYRGAWLGYFGISGAMLPADVRSITSFGALHLLGHSIFFLKFVALTVATVLCGAMALGQTKHFQKVKQFLTTHLPDPSTLIDKEFVPSLIGLLSILCLFLFATLIGIAVIEAEKQGRSSAQRFVQTALALSNGTPATDTQIRNARIIRSLSGDIKESAVYQGFSIGCSEKFCVLLKFDAEERWFAEVVPLDKATKVEFFAPPRAAR